MKDHRNASVKALGYLRAMFTIQDVDELVARLKTQGAQLAGEIVQYEPFYKLCYVRSSDGILVGLAQPL